ncbi:MAG: response regulator [Candidatus Brocadiae bacterium]|nr:response regulator [Candidatus Brocadiia bacterium]
MPRSLRARFTVLFAAFVLLPIGAVSAIGFVATRSLAEQSLDEYARAANLQARDEHLEAVRVLAGAQDRTFGDIERRAQAMASQAARLYEKRDIYERSGLWTPSRFKRGGYGWMTDDPDGAAVWAPAGFDPVAGLPELQVLAHVEQILLTEPAAPAMTQWYMIHRSGLSVLAPLPPAMPEDADFDPRESQFYVPAAPAANPDGRVVWTGVYNDPAGHGVMISCLAPIGHGDRFEGVIGIDVNADDFQAQLAGGGQTWEFGVLLDGQGRILLMTPGAYALFGISPPAHHREEPLDWRIADIPDPALRDLCGRLPQTEDGLTTLRAAGKDRVVAHRKIPSTEWTLAVIGDPAHLTAPVLAMRETQRTLYRQFLVLLISLIGVLLVSGTLFAVFLSRQVARPVLALASAARRLGAGQPVTIVPPGGFGEIDTLAATLRQMVSDREEAQRAIAEAQKLSALGGLASGICHELNNLLAPILGFAQVLSRGPLTADQRAQIERVERAARGAREIVGSLLDSTHELAGVRRPTDVNAVVREAMGQLEQMVEAAEVQLVLDLDPGLPMTMANPALLQRAVYNIANNGLQAMLDRPGVRRLTVRTSVAPSQDPGAAGNAAQRIAIRVEDSGPGVPRELRARIFDPFFTTKPPGSGTGLGLSVATSCVRSHSGQIQVEDAPGGGAAFLATFPVVLPPMAADARHQTSTPPVPATTKPRVLVVDDEDSIRILVRHALSADVTLVECDSGAAALSALESGEFDAVLCDLRLRDMSGRDIHAWIRTHREGLLKRFVVLTGDTHGEETLGFLEEFRTPCLTKPFDLDELRERVLSMLGNSR